MYHFVSLLSSESANEHTPLETIYVALSYLTFFHLFFFCMFSPNLYKAKKVLTTDNCRVLSIFGSPMKLKRRQIR
jgi:hypothetical protein